MAQVEKVFKGSFFHTAEYGKIEYLDNVLVEVDSEGIIVSVITRDDDNYQDKYNKYKVSGELIEFKEGEYLLPGFIDLHIHAPQWAQAGLALDDELSNWLMKYTFPLEAKYKDVDFAREVYSNLVKELLKNGTTSAMYFGTIHNEATLELAKISSDLGQRAFVGKVVMDDKIMNPEFYRDSSTEEALVNTEKFIIDVKNLSKDVKQGVYPVVTPRFVPSCTDEALEGLGKLAEKYNSYIQSHCSESDWEDNFVKERFGKSDTEVLNEFGLLTEKSIMAHCNFLTESDGRIFADNSSSVCHCPISNSYFANAVLPVRHLHNNGVNVSLGSDISGGYSPSLYHNIRHTVMVSRMLNDGVNNRLSSDKRGCHDSKVSVIEAFYLATVGGGKALKLPLGLIKEGYIFDIQVIDINDPKNKLPNFYKEDNKKDILQKILYLATKDNIKQVWVQGECVIS